jgi:hypothetical protein
MVVVNIVIFFQELSKNLLLGFLNPDNPPAGTLIPVLDKGIAGNGAGSVI